MKNALRFSLWIVCGFLSAAGFAMLAPDWMLALFCLAGLLGSIIHAVDAWESR